MPGWYDILSLDEINREEDAAGFEASRKIGINITFVLFTVCSDEFN